MSSSIVQYSAVWFSGLIVGGLLYVPFFVVVAVRSFANTGAGFTDD